MDAMRYTRSSWGLWAPSRKWAAAQVVGLGGVATSAIESGWDATEWKLLVALAVQAAVTYLVPNAETAPSRENPRGR
jgi:hypothetical protein